MPTLHSRSGRALTVVAAALFLIGACSDSDDTAEESPDSSAPETDVSEAEVLVPDPNSAEPDLLTPEGLDSISIGTTEADAIASGAVEEWMEGCPVAGEDHNTALLAGPVTGQTYSAGGAVKAVLVIEGPITTEPGGVAVGMSREEAIAAFDADGLTMEVDESTVEMWGEYFWSVSEDGRQIFGGSISPETGNVTAIATPFIPICD